MPRLDFVYRAAYLSGKASVLTGWAGRVDAAGCSR